jgi:hypothetical protein
VSRMWIMATANCCRSLHERTGSLCDVRRNCCVIWPSNGIMKDRRNKRSAGFIFLARNRFSMEKPNVRYRWNYIKLRYCKNVKA